MTKHNFSFFRTHAKQPAGRQQRQADDGWALGRSPGEAEVVHVLRVLRRPADHSRHRHRRPGQHATRISGTERQRDADGARHDFGHARNPEIQEEVQLGNPLRRSVGRQPADRHRKRVDAARQIRTGLNYLNFSSLN